MQTKLTAADVVPFMYKNMLLQNIDAISLDNYEEQFLLYIDKELDKEDKEGVEKFVLQHPQFQDEFTLLKQTVLEPEVLVFEDKASLLRKEERRIIPMFLRFAAAAAIIGIAVLVWWMQDNNTITKPGVASVKIDSARDNTASVNTSEEKKVLPETIAKQQQDQIKDEATASVKKQAVKETKNSIPGKDKEENMAQKNIAVISPETKNENIAAIDKPDAAHDNETANNTATTLNNNATDYTVAADKDQHANDNGVRFADNGDSGSASNNYAKNAVYKELNTNEEEDRNSLYLGSMQINKNKVRGFVKKVGGLFAGKSKEASANKDGKLQIANLELNTN